MHKSNTSGWGIAKNKNQLLKGMLAMACWFSMSAISVQAAVLENIQFSGLPGNKVQLELSLDSAPGQLKSFSTDNPARIAIDLLGVTNGAGKTTIPINIGKAVSVRALEAGGRTRVVLNLSDAAPYATKVEGKSVFVTLGNVTGVPITSGPSAVPLNNKEKAVSGIDFRRGEEGEGRVLVSLTDTSSVVDVKQEGDKVIVDIHDTGLPQELANRLDVLDFATPVKTINVMPVGGDTRLSISAIGQYEFLSYQMDELLTIEFKPLTKQEQEELAAEKFPYTGEKLSLNFQSIEVRSVLQLLADFTDMNLVASDSVGGSVTLRLNNVPWDQALDIILKSKGLAKRINGNVMMVGPQAEVAAQEKLELEAKKQVVELSPLLTEFFEISYAKATDLVSILKSTGGNDANNSDSKLISNRGGVSVDQRTNTLLVQETAEKLVEIRRIIERLDRPVRQVMIESRIVIANDDFTRDLGVRFGLSGIDQSNDSISVAAGSLENGVDVAGGNIFDVGGSEGLLVDLPAASPAGAIQFIVGKIGSSLLQLELSALQTEAKGEVISSPRVITSDQIEAEISQGVEIPFQEASSSGATSTSFEEAELSLTVTPRITPDDRINLELNITKDSPDFSNVQPGGVPINTQEVDTTVLVNNGDTVVLGGIYERSKDHSVRKVPFFGDLPAVGVLFKKDFKQDNNRELLFFITPKILKDNLVVN
ncbi:MAG: pilus assembly protein PilQ [Cycloclasticus sp.]|nr:pilus assembly protein PilQ [Cycloclasticus sp.]MBG95828.1 pilus assembly protein PilQ [Cycloclasticus sp.]HAI96094.1 type IV pilus secretin PilQ [Methylococcaceae bacterium]